jgi:hypothetical protein
MRLPQNVLLLGQQTILLFIFAKTDPFYDMCLADQGKMDGGGLSWARKESS